MSYPPLLRLATEADYRKHFENSYCRGVITTFDGIAVRFRKQNFDHCFFESSHRDRVKDKFSTRRAERLDWIKVALADPTSERYWGWDRQNKRYDYSRRVTVVMGNYVVVIVLKGDKTADFVTAYVADTVGTRGRKSTIELIRSGPKCA
jgi:hypothetical protein